MITSSASKFCRALLPVWVMKEVSEHFSKSVHLDHVDQWVRRAAAEDAPFNVVKLIVTHMRGVPHIPMCFNPVEAVVAPSANPKDVIFMVSTVAVAPAPAELALSPERVPVGHVEEGATGRMHVDSNARA